MKKIILLLATAAIVSTIGCKTTSLERKAKMQQSSGKMTRGSDVGYYAICTNLVAGSHADIWTGTVWPDKSRAMRDAVDHNKEYPGHTATYRK